MLGLKTKCVVAAVCTIVAGCGSSDDQKAPDDKSGFDASLEKVIGGYPANADLEKSLVDAFRAGLPQGGQDREIYPDVVDGLENEGGVPSRLMKTDAGVGRQEGTPCRMFAGSPLRGTMRSRSRWTSSPGRVLAG
jgi:hypothetical protein